VNLEITESTELKGRALRKWRAKKKVDKILRNFIEELDKRLATESVDEANKLVVRYINETMRQDPRNNVLYTQAAIKYRESFKMAIDFLISNEIKAEVKTEEVVA